MIIFANCNPIHRERIRALAAEYTGRYVEDREALNAVLAEAEAIDYVFFYHWSWIIPASIHEAFDCVLFHMTDLPYGRGGSPLQNLIVNGRQDTMMSAIRVVDGLDEGPVYLKKPLSLLGTAREIFLRSGSVMEAMTRQIIQERPEPVEQQGEITLFKRRKPNQSDLDPLKELEEVFDYIRMLDSDGYPPAFVESTNFRFEFSRASLHQDQIIADVRITKK